MYGRLAGYFFLLSVFLIFNLTDPIAVAQEDEVDLTAISLEALMELEVETVYGASRFEQKVTDAPSNVTVVTSDDIKKYGYRTLADILNSAGGFYTTYDRSYHYLGVRGFARPGDYNTRILLLVDGVRLNDSIYEGATIGRDFILDVDLIDRVEIIRGPSSSIYGSNAFFGVVNVVSKEGEDLQGLQVSGEAGSFETYKARLSYGNAFQNGLDLVLSGTYYDSEGDNSLYFPEYDDPSTNNGIAEHSDSDQAYNFLSKLSYRDFSFEGAFVSREKSDPTGAYDTVFNNPSRIIDEAAFFDLNYEHDFPDKVGVKARVYYAYYDYDGDYVYDYAEKEGEEPYIVTNIDYCRAEWWGTEALFSKTLFEKHKFIWGGELQDRFRQDQGNYDEVVYLDDQRDSTLWALFVQDEFQILDSLILNAGLRYDHYSTFGGTTNPRLALIFSPVEKTTIKLLYGRAFRSPNAYEFYYHDGGETHKANPALEPETIDTYELVLEQNLGDHFRGKVSGYFYRVEDLITLCTDPEDDLLIFENVQPIEAKGLELELECQCRMGLRGRISYAIQEANDQETGQVLTNSPRHLAKIKLAVPLVKEKLFAGIEALYMSKRRTLAGDYVDGNFITHVTLFNMNLLKNLEISANIYNLFDEKYADPGSEEHLQDAIEQDGRTFRLKLTYTF